MHRQSHDSVGYEGTAAIADIAVLGVDRNHVEAKAGDPLPAFSFGHADRLREAAHYGCVEPLPLVGHRRGARFAPQAAIADFAAEIAVRSRIGGERGEGGAFVRGRDRLAELAAERRAGFGALLCAACVGTSAAARRIAFIPNSLRPSIMNR